MKKKPLLVCLKKAFPSSAEKELYGAVLCGEVLAGGEKIRDPKALIPLDLPLKLVKKKYVSRGGYKLEGVLKLWNLPVEGRLILDAGASAGGFTDCLLRHGAQGVYAVDVGYNQLDYSLRCRQDVRVMERTNIMDVKALTPQPDWAVADLSFRSLRSAASHILNLTVQKKLIALMKPQFEMKFPPPDFDGVLRDPRQILRVAAQVMDELAAEGAWVHRAALSPVQGRKGNQELLFEITEDRPDIPKEGTHQQNLLNLLEVDLLKLKW